MPEPMNMHVGRHLLRSGLDSYIEATTKESVWWPGVPIILASTRTTRTPAFWDTPAAPWLPILEFHIGSQVKTRQSKSYKLKKNAKNSNCEFLQETLHTAHLLKLLDKMYKYETDPTRTVGATERTRDVDGQTDRWADGVKLIYPPQQLRFAGGIIMSVYHVCR